MGPPACLPSSCLPAWFGITLHPRCLPPLPPAPRSIQLIPAADGFDTHSVQKDVAHLPNIRRELGVSYADMCAVPWGWQQWIAALPSQLHLLECCQAGDVQQPALHQTQCDPEGVQAPEAWAALLLPPLQAFLR